MVCPLWAAVLGSGTRVDADNRKTTNPLTGEPDAGNPPVRFGGRGGAKPTIPTPIIHTDFEDRELRGLRSRIGRGRIGLATLAGGLLFLPLRRALGAAGALPGTQFLGLARVFVVHDGVEFGDVIADAPQDLADEFGVFDASLGFVLIVFVGVGNGADWRRIRQGVRRRRIGRARRL